MWCAPYLPSELGADCFDLPRRAREIDMRASPYDLRGLGYEPIRVESPDGRREYVNHQRAIAEEAARLRSRLVDAMRTLEAYLLALGCSIPTRLPSVSTKDAYRPMPGMSSGSLGV